MGMRIYMSILFLTAPADKFRLGEPAIIRRLVS